MEEGGYKIFGMFHHEHPKNYHSRYDNYGRITITLVKRDEQGKITNFINSNEDNPLYLADLRLTCQYHVENGEVSGLYGWSLCYKPYRVDLHEAERMVKTLKKIERKLDVITKEWGQADEFGVYAMRFLKVIGGKGLLKLTKEGRGWDYSSNEYQERGLTDVNHAILCEVAEIKEKVEAAAGVRLAV